MDWREQVLMNCIVAHPGATVLNETEFADIRRTGIGASDASVILGTNPWASLEELREDKLAKGLTARNMDVASKASVRKGRDLEPLILEKAEALLGTDVVKPDDMYRLKNYPWLTINYDGIARFFDQWLPVEAKMVSTFGEKQWNWGKSWAPGYMMPRPFMTTSQDVKQRCEQAGEHYGIPPYYYCQLQQQMLGLDSSFGLMAALHDKDWTLRLYLVHRDRAVQEAIIERGRIWWNSIAAHKNEPPYPETNLQVPETKLAEEIEY